MKFDFTKAKAKVVRRNTNTQEKFLLGAILRARYGKRLRTEYRFCPTRKFRADYYVPSLNVLIEYEGVFGGKNPISRHTNVNGYTADCEKYNLAQIFGYRVLRYTAKNYTQVTADLDELEEDLKVGGTE